MSDAPVQGPSHWADDARGRAYRAAYEASLELWPIPYGERVIETDHGSTHVVVSGRTDGAPVVLLHAASLSATQWYPQARDLGARYRLYAVDILADIGLSTQALPLRSRADGAAWLAGLLDGLGLETATFIGSSFGGFHATNLAVADPDRVRSLVLLAPAATVLPFRLTATIMIRSGSLWPMPFTVRPGLRGMMQGELPDERIVHQMEVGVAGFRYDRRSLFPSAFSDAELASVDCPTLLLLGDREMIYDPQAATRRVRACMTEVEAEIMPGVGHLLGLQRPEPVNVKVLGFLERHGDAR